MFHRRGTSGLDLVNLTSDVFQGLTLSPPHARHIVGSWWCILGSWGGQGSAVCWQLHQCADSQWQPLPLPTYMNLYGLLPFSRPHILQKLLPWRRLLHWFFSQHSTPHLIWCPAGHRIPVPGAWCIPNWNPKSLEKCQDHLGWAVSWPWARILWFIPAPWCRELLHVVREAA